MKYRATLSEKQPLDFRRLDCGRFDKGVTRDFETDDPEIVKSLKRKGIDLVPADEVNEDEPKKATRSSRGKE